MLKKKYANWKRDNIAAAKQIRNQLEENLGRVPTRRDFKESGNDNVWMALNRAKRAAIEKQPKGALFIHNIAVGLDSLSPDEFLKIKQLIDNTKDKKKVEQIFECCKNRIVILKS